MIRILDRYIARSVILSTILVGFVILGVLILLSLLSELRNIGIGDYGLLQAIYYVILRIPNQLYQFSPMMLLLGAVISLSLLSSQRELPIMRISGLTTRQIILSVFKAALLLIIFFTAIGEGFAPALSYFAEIKKEIAQNAGQAVVTASGVWFHVDDNFIHVDRVVNRQLLEGVTRYQFNKDRQLQNVTYAKKLQLEDKNWIMHDVKITSFYPRSTRSQFLSKADWQLKLNMNLLNVGLIDPNEMSLKKLAHFYRYLERNGLQASDYEYEFWQRIFKPLASLIMVILAIPFVLSIFSQYALGLRVSFGIVLGFAFFIANSMLGEVSIVYQIPPILAALLPILIFTGISVWVLRNFSK